MVKHSFLFFAFILIFSHSLVFANSFDPSFESKMISTGNSFQKNDSNCQNVQYDRKKFRPETVKALAFPPGAFVEVKKCLDERAQRKRVPSEEELIRAKIEQKEIVKKLSLLLSFIYHQQKNLAGSYKKTDRAYNDLTQKDFPLSKVYESTVENYEDALKSYGEYQAYLSALPRAVSEYEKKVGSSFKDFSLQNEDGIITLLKAPQITDLSKSSEKLDIKTGEASAASETTEENSSESGNLKTQKEARQNFCMLAGAFAGTTVTEGIILTTLSNPLSALLGASLGATLCSEKFYEKMTLWPRSLGEKLVDMGSYIKDGLENIGTGLLDIGKKYLYVGPSKANEKIAEHFETAKSWLNGKLGWQ